METTQETMQTPMMTMTASVTQMNVNGALIHSMPVMVVTPMPMVNKDEIEAGSNPLDPDDTKKPKRYVPVIMDDLLIMIPLVS